MARVLVGVKRVIDYAVKVETFFSRNITYEDLNINFDDICFVDSC